MTQVINNTKPIWWTLTILCYILGILQIYGIYSFCSIRKLLIVQKRYPRMILFEASGAVILCLLFAPFSIDWGMNVMNIVHDEKSKQILEGIGYEAVYIIWKLNFTTEIARLWLIWFNLNYLVSNRNEKWKSSIDESFAQKNWFLKNKQKYTNTRSMMKIYVIYNFIGCFLSMLVYYISGYLWLREIFDNFIYTPCYILAIYMYCKLPSVDDEDNFLFRYEFVLTIYTFGICVVIYPANFITQILAEPVLHWTIVSVLEILPVLVSLLSTIWIPIKIRQQMVWEDENGLLLNERRMEETINLDEKMDQEANVTKEQQSVQSSLRDAFGDEVVFETFVRWMYREYSSVSILCFIELVQFKEGLIKFVEKNKDKYNAFEQEEDAWYMGIFYDSIPKSSIVSRGVESDDADIETWQNVAHLLYEKYIESGSEFEVNIPNTVRDEYQQNDHNNWNVEIQQLFGIWDPVLHDMLTLMRASFLRFSKQL